jgi:hypothetical protein
MASTQSSSEQSKPDVDTDVQIPHDKPDDEEFKITVKKLETVVKPRGVLADG